MSVWILSQQPADTYENVRLLEEFSKAKIHAKLMHPDDFDIIVNKNNNKSIKYQGTNINLPKLVLTRTGSGTNYFTNAVIRQLERLGVPTINCNDSIDRVKDKLLTHQILSYHNIPTPRTILVKFPVSSDVVEKEIGFPCVVKVIQGSYGKGVHLCPTKDAFTKLMDLIADLAIKKIMIVQEFIATKAGSDLRVWVIGGKVVGAMKRTGPDGDFRANITNGGCGEPFAVTEEIDVLCRETAKVLGLDIAGIDLLFDNDGFKVCEANSAPGFEGFETYCQVNIAKHVIDYIKFKLS